DIPADTFYLRISTPRPLTKKGKYKVEFGDKATDYTDAPEDFVLDTEIEDPLKIYQEELLKK
ncbi:hypothetical protein, partial [Apibacter sp. B3239]|uniref:hypothetical protein n=1 Tax=Apibacter sp. B3239 TaxID=2656764 RepID=UPI0013683EC3